MCFLYSIFSKKNKEKGFSLIEVLTAIGLATFATLVSQALFQMSIRNFNVQNKVTVMMDEQQLYEILTKTIGDQGKSCEGNLKPSGASFPQASAQNKAGFYGGRLSNGQDYKKGVGGLLELHTFNSDGSRKSTTPLVSIGPFMQYLNVVRMDLTADLLPTDPNFKTAQDFESKRRFTVYYKYKQGLVKIDTNAGATCTSADVSGCYRLYCELNPYELNTAGVGVKNGKCQATCTRPNWGGGGGSADIKCADGTSAVKIQPDGTTLFGCGTTQANTNTTTTALGYNAGNSGAGAENTFIGYESGKVTTNRANTFIGYRTGIANTTGNNNTFLGLNAGEKNTTGHGNTFLGSTTGVHNTGGTNNTFVGIYAGASNTTGVNNTFIGNGAGNTNLDTNRNTYLGRSAGYCFAKGNNNVFIGEQSGLGRQTAAWTCPTDKESNTGSDNVIIGKDAAFGLKSGSKNVFIGYRAGFNNPPSDISTTNVITGGENVAIGYQSGNKLTTGGYNVFIGKEAGEDNTSGDDNIFIGKGAGEHNKGGIDKAGDYQLNIGNLIFGRMPSSAPGSTINFFPPTGSGTNKYLKDGDNQKDGLVIYGNLYVHGKAFANCGDNGTCGPWSTSLGTPSSSKIHKKNITPFVEFEKSLTDITTTPLFTYEYKEDHPDHQRMGIIAEDLPPHLQIKDQYEPVKPDWVSIYGTFWAGIKALFNKVTNLTKSILRLNSITSSLKVNLYEVKEKLEDLHGVKDRLEVLEKETQFLRKQNKELKKDNKELKRQIKTLNKKMKVSQ